MPEHAENVKNRLCDVARQPSPLAPVRGQKKAVGRPPKPTTLDMALTDEILGLLPEGGLRAAAMLRSLRDASETLMHLLVRELRNVGTSWREIGEAVGMSAQSAQMAHARFVERSSIGHSESRPLRPQHEAAAKPEAQHPSSIVTLRPSTTSPEWIPSGDDRVRLIEIVVEKTQNELIADHAADTAFDAILGLTGLAEPPTQGLEAWVLARTRELVQEPWRRAHWARRN